MRLATWNINSVRLRIALMAQLKRNCAPDVLCLQETKCPNEAFPKKAFQRLGYTHFALNGIKGYHGVAIVSRLPFADTLCLDLMRQNDGRHIAVQLAQNGHKLWVHNFYVPAGGDIPEPKTQPKFAYKLDYLDAMAKHFRKKPQASKQVLVGDLNVAPLENDVWSHKQLQNIVCHTPMEVERFAKLQQTLAWEDVGRRFVAPTEKLYSWWSYRARDWQTSNRGRRLDHILLTPALSRFCKAYRILTRARGWQRPSDHTPVLAEFTF